MTKKPKEEQQEPAKKAAADVSVRELLEKLVDIQEQQRLENNRLREEMLRMLDRLTTNTTSEGEISSEDDTFEIMEEDNTFQESEKEEDDYGEVEDSTVDEIDDQSEPVVDEYYIETDNPCVNYAPSYLPSDKSSPHPPNASITFIFVLMLSNMHTILRILAQFLFPYVIGIDLHLSKVKIKIKRDAGLF